MKPQTLPTKRRPASKGFFKRLSAVTGNRKQRVAATATAEDMEVEDGSSKISRAMTIIFMIHIVAIGLMFVHQKFLSSRNSGEAVVSKPKQSDSLTTPTRAQRGELPLIEASDESEMVSQGDNYATMAARHGVDEGELRLLNNHSDIMPGIVLKIPKKRAEAVVPPPAAAALAEITPQAIPVEDLVEVRSSATAPAAVIDIEEAEPEAVAVAPRAKAVQESNKTAAIAPKAKPVVKAQAKVLPKPKASGKTYVVKSGDSIWKIANKLKVNQAQLMKANGITDAKKIKAGASLVIPQ